MIGGEEDLLLVLLVVFVFLFVCMQLVRLGIIRLGFYLPRLSPASAPGLLGAGGFHEAENSQEVPDASSSSSCSPSKKTLGRFPYHVLGRNLQQEGFGPFRIDPVIDEPGGDMQVAIAVPVRRKERHFSLIALSFQGWTSITRLCSFLFFLHLVTDPSRHAMCVDQDPCTLVYEVETRLFSETPEGKNEKGLGGGEGRETRAGRAKQKLSAFEEDMQVFLSMVDGDRRTQLEILLVYVKLRLCMLFCVEETDVARYLFLSLASLSLSTVSVSRFLSFSVRVARHGCGSGPSVSKRGGQLDLHVGEVGPGQWDSSAAFPDSSRGEE